MVERRVIRSIKYDGNKSVSTSEILDRFKEKKVGLTVESSFDPTRIKKAEVVLKDLLGEHGRQFAAVTPQYEKIASSNAVILVFKIDEDPKVKVGPAALSLTNEGAGSLGAEVRVKATRDGGYRAQLSFATLEEAIELARRLRPRALA